MKGELFKHQNILMLFKLKYRESPQEAFSNLIL